QLANKTQAVIVNVGYRLAPEHPFPQGLEDCYKATVWAQKNAARFSADPAKIAVSGVSAGGNLAAAVCLMARGRKRPDIKCQLLLYPCMTDELDKKEYAASPDQGFITYDSMKMLWQLYLPDDTEIDDANGYAAPLKAKNLKNLPMAFVMTAEYDPLRKEGKSYANRLQEEGNKVIYRTYPKMIHAFLILPVELDQHNAALDDIAQFVQRNM
ncbi:MAG TPA: alpha/beta hydrolase, partial [Chlamydiales bacterium]|nr:alpha/beta hydrolase [Chlamydiales bacterium]